MDLFGCMYVLMKMKKTQAHINQGDANMTHMRLPCLALWEMLPKISIVTCIYRKIIQLTPVLSVGHFKFNNWSKALQFHQKECIESAILQR